MSEHPKPEVVAYLLHGVYAEDQVREASQHVLAGCSSCRALLDPRAAAIVGGKPESVVSSLLRAHRRQAALLKEAIERFAKLGVASVESAPRRLRGVAGVVTLLSLSLIAREKARSLHIPYALFARLLADQLDPCKHGERQVAELRCQAALLLAQGYCFNAQLERANQAIGWAAEAFLCSFQRPQIKAHILSTWATIDTALGRPEKARQAIGAALAIFRETGDRDGQAIALALSSVHESFAGQAEKAIKLMREARLDLDEERYPALYLRTIHSQAKLLVSLGKFREARILLWTNLGRYASYADEQVQVERTALEGVINDGLGKLDEAARDLLAAVLGFVDLKDDHSAAITSLDIAAVLLDQKMPQEALESAKIGIDMFQTLVIPEEAHAALLVVKEAFDRQLADSDLLRRTARYLRELRHTPEARFLPEL